MPMRPPARQRQLFWLVGAIAGLGAGLLSVPWSLMADTENHWLDFCFQWRDEMRGRVARPEPPRSVIIGAADSTFNLAELAPHEVAREPLAAMTAPWPWNRRVFADVVRKLRASGARAIVFDIFFDGKNQGDEEFARALAEPGAPVVLASLLQPERTALGELTVKHQEPVEALRAAAGGRVGFVNLPPDRDAVLRTMTTSIHQAEVWKRQPVAGAAPLPSLAQAARLALHPDADRTPVSGYIDFLGPKRTIPTRAIEELFLPDRWKTSLQSGDLFRGRVVWIGMLSEVQLHDTFVTPLDGMDGVEVQAQAFETLMGAGPLQPFSNAAMAVCVWALALGGVLVAWTSLRVSWQLAIILAGVAGWGGLVFGLFATRGTVVPFLGPVLAWLVAGGGGVGVRFILEQRARRRLRGVLGRYVSEEVAQIIAEQPEEFIQLQRGTQRPVTVLFADLRGFTSWAEKTPPEIVVAQLNEYFGVVVGCVLAHRGTLQKFIGDAVLAVWGDTRSSGPGIDTARAVDAALAMQAAVVRLNASWAGRADRTPTAVGIGLHHGIAMVGNVGHAQRMEFTVLGDVVNVAARLESANRQLGSTLLVSGTIRDLVVESHRCVSLGRFGLKGRSEGVDLFVPLGPQAEAAPAWLAPADVAREAWQAGDFRAAAAAYLALSRPSEPLAEFFRLQAERAEQLAAAPPPRWNGEYRLDSK